jgi:hypothetical protein
MWIVLIAAVVVVVVAAATLVVRRPRGSDLSSVAKYHTALGTIEQMAERTGRPTAGTAVPSDGGQSRGRSSSGAGRRPGRAVPPVPVRGNGEFPDPGEPIVFDDARPQDHIRGDGLTPGAPMHRADRAQRNALESMNRRPRRATAVMAVVVVVALIGALAALGSFHNNPSHHTDGTSSVSNTASTSSGSGGSHNGGSGSGSKTKKHHQSPPTTTPTTTPTQVVAISSSSTGTTATYPAPTSGSYTLTITATSSPCWVQVTSASTGAALWTGTLQAGGSQVVPGSGTVTVQLGAPSGKLALDNIPVVFPNPVHTPFIATFQPTAAGSVPVTTTTTVPVTSTTVVPSPSTTAPAG